ncbi:hypothetical protein V6N13_054685 [Hibiscus sabdariffa]|uniref:Uncharacterized protein n=1 Tax=Hibiscus sabdariffa TaxID=183260 RepID=A0ABR2DYR5_9ROSI
MTNEPAITSTPPLMNLEILWRTTSASKRAGESTIGVKVLSTTTVVPFSCPILLSSGMLATVSVGFDIDSKYMTLVFPSTMSFFTASRSPMSTNVVVMLQAQGKKCVRSAWVLP